MTETDDLRLCVDESNDTVLCSGRRVLIGLVNHDDGLAGARRRVELAGAVLDDFGVAAVCGYGREDPAGAR
jgi:hypothetical protein